MDKQLFDAAKEGDVEKVKELLSKGVGTEYKDEVTFSSVITLEKLESLLLSPASSLILSLSLFTPS